MDENVFAAVLLDETVAFGGVKPFDRGESAPKAS
jgi:hypothetical protein